MQILFIADFLIETGPVRFLKSYITTSCLSQTWMISDTIFKLSSKYISMSNITIFHNESHFQIHLKTCCNITMFYMLGLRREECKVLLALYACSIHHPSKLSFWSHSCGLSADWLGLAVNLVLWGIFSQTCAITFPLFTNFRFCLSNETLVVLGLADVNL